jgi:hypothetical protein
MNLIHKAREPNNGPAGLRSQRGSVNRNKVEIEIDLRGMRNAYIERLGEQRVR